MPDQDILDKAYERGVEAGRIDTRVRGLEANQLETTKALASISVLINSTITTVQLLASESKNRAESDRKMWEQRDKSALETAKAIREEKDNAAKAIREEKDAAADVLKNERETTATALLKESTATNSKWAPRMGWLTFALVFVGIIGSLVTFYATFHK